MDMTMEVLWSRDALARQYASLYLIRFAERKEIQPIGVPLLDHVAERLSLQHPLVRSIHHRINLAWNIRLTIRHLVLCKLVLNINVAEHFTQRYIAPN